MSYLTNYRIIFPDAHLDDNYALMFKTLSMAGIRVTSEFDADNSPDAVLTWFHGRGRITRKTHALLKNMDCPVIGVELAEEGDRNDPVIWLDFQLNHDSPYPLIAHTIIKIIEASKLRLLIQQEETSLEKLKNRLDHVVKLGIQLTGTLSPHDLFDLVANHAASIVSGCVHAVFTMDIKKSISQLKSMHTRKNCGPFRVTPTHRIQPKIKQALVKTAKPVADVFPFNNYPWINQLTDLGNQVSSVIVAPFLSKKHLHGFLVVGRLSEESPFTNAEIELIEVLSSFSSIAIANAFVYEQTEMVSRIDDLTKVFNFNYIKQFLDRLITANESFSLVFIDLDGFKRINLLYGHTTGNKALYGAASKILDNLIPYSMVGRFGGDEFVIIMPGTAADDAKNATENIISAIESLETEEGFHLSASAGIAEYPLDSDELNALIHAADTAMYAAKDQGRGHAILFREFNKES
ncbi:sensor domain-containing diguanylate cyclase [bacterium]|nr:sensor domain-containing diguanylate cyclase [bacterium]